MKYIKHSRQNLLHHSINQAVIDFEQNHNPSTASGITPMTLRMPDELKRFYECLASSESTSLQAVMIGTLKLVFKNSVEQANIENPDIFFKRQIDRFLTILKDNSFDLNDLPELLSFITKKKIDRKSLYTEPFKIYSLMNKSHLMQFAQLFGYGYPWLAGQVDDCHDSQFNYFEETWYHDITAFLRRMIQHYRQDSSATKLRLIFLCNDLAVDAHIIQDKSVTAEYALMPVLHIERQCNDINFSTYHALSANSISHLERRHNFVKLINALQSLQRAAIIQPTILYYLPTPELRAVIDGLSHVCTLFHSKKPLQSMDFQALINADQQPSCGEILGVDHDKGGSA